MFIIILLLIKIAPTKNENITFCRGESNSRFHPTFYSFI